MNQNHLKNLFDWMKQHNFYEEYEDWDDYRQKKWGDAQDKEKEFESFKESLLAEEKKQFNFIFNEDEKI